MTIYLAGKISGDPNYKEKFRKAKESLEEKGHAVLNPAELPEGKDPAFYMQLCMQMLFVADEAAFLPDWPTSAGAGIEYQICRYIEKPVMMIPEPPKEET